MIPTMTACGVLALLCFQPAAAQWTVTSLGQGTVGDTAPGQQVGQSAYLSHAVSWAGTAASMVDLNPAGFAVSTARGTTGTEQIGGADVSSFWTNSHACRWSGTAASFVDLHPAGAFDSMGEGTSGTQQVGTVRLSAGADFHAALWTGSAGSFVDLHPAGTTGPSRAFRTDGALQGGEAGNHAGIWAGSAATWVDLNPAGANGSTLRDLVPGQQVGSATFGTPSGIQNHAAIWNGSAATFFDVHPAGTNSSQLLGTTGVWQVGWWRATGSSPARAGIWKGSAATFVDLHSVLGASYANYTSFATSITDVGGMLVVGGWAAPPGSFTPQAWISTLPAFALTATTLGGGFGNLTIGLVGIRPTATHGWIGASATPAPGGPGTGAFYGLVYPDPLLISMMAEPPAPFSLIHFPVSASPYAAGTLFFGPGSLSALAGQTWDAIAVCYGPVDGVSGMSAVKRLVW